MRGDLLLYLHVIGATVLLGTGAGIAFFMAVSNRGRDPALIAHVAGIVVVADTVFTTVAAIVQPITGYLLVRELHWSLAEGWIALSFILYLVTGLFWLPVVWMQIRLRDLARSAARTGSALPASYHRLYRIWFAFGFPAFLAVLAIVWLMVTKPSFDIGW